MLNASLQSEVLVLGAIIAASLAGLFSKSAIFEDVRLTPAAFWATIQWLVIFSIELVKSNVDVMLRVISPKVRINPAIVEVKTKLKSKLGRLMLANSITLTPGTLTVDISGDKIYIHWIDASSTDIDEVTNLIVRKFEKPLEVIFG